MPLVLSPGLSPIAHSRDNGAARGPVAAPYAPAQAASPLGQTQAQDSGRNSSLSSSSGSGASASAGTVVALQELSTLCGELRAEVAEQSLCKVQRLAVVARNLANGLGGVRGQALGARLSSVCNELARDFDLLRLEGEAAAAASSRSSSRCGGARDAGEGGAANTSVDSLNGSGLRLVPAPAPVPMTQTRPAWLSSAENRRQPPPVQLPRRALPRVPLQ